MAVFAISLPACDGDTTQVDLLHTPGVISKGVKSDANYQSSKTIVLIAPPPGTVLMVK